MLEQIVAVVFGIGFAVTGLLLLRYAYRRIYSASRVLVTPEIPAEEVSERDGYVSVQGDVTATETVPAAVSGRESVFYHAQAKYHSTSNTPRWRTFTFERESVPFALRDSTGSVRVHLGIGDDEEGRSPHDALPFDIERKANLGELTEREDEFLRKDGGDEYLMRQFSDTTDKSVKLFEKCIEPGDTIHVSGPVTRVGGALVIVANRVTEERFDGVLWDIVAGTGYALFALFLLYSVYVVTLPTIANLV